MSFLNNIKNPLNWVSGDIAIDLGTANTLVYIKRKGDDINAACGQLRRNEVVQIDMPNG